MADCIVDAAHGFPQEMIEEILLRLPTKSMVRFKQVSKTWCNLITSSRFVNHHFMNCQEGYIAQFNIARPKAKTERYRRFLVTCLRNDHEGTKPVLNFGFEIRSCPSISNLELIGNCNGVVCLMIDSVSIMLVNPSLKEMKTLPTSRFDNSAPCFQLIGLGFDNTNMDFKVVRIIGLLEERNAVHQGQHKRAEVYTLKTNGWRKLTQFPLVTDRSIIAASTFLKGAVHWCARINYLDWRVLSFDMTTESFQQIALPQDWNNDGDAAHEHVPALFVFNQESLAFVTYCRHPEHHVVNIWTMEKHKSDVAWTKMYTIGPLPGLLKPIGFRNESGFLYSTGERMLISYDLLNESNSVVCEDVSHLKPGHVLDFYNWLMVLCRPSLASINM